MSLAAAVSAIGITALPARAVDPPVTLTLVSGGGSGGTGTNDPIVSYQTTGGSSGQARIATPHSLYAAPISGTRWINTTGNASSDSGDQASNKTTIYSATFSLPLRYTSPTITVNVMADNAATVRVNGMLVGEQGYQTAPGNAANYTSVSTFSLSTSAAFHPGSNTLTISNVDFAGANAVDFKADVTYTPDAPSPADLATAMLSTTAPGGLVTGASYALAPPSGTPNAVSTSALAGYPLDGSSYAILTSGNATLAPNTPQSNFANTSDGGSGQRGTNAFDVTDLQVGVNVPSGANCLTVGFRFFSEEFPEFKGSAYNDAFIAELDVNDWSAGTVSNPTITAPHNFAFARDDLGNPEAISINSIGDSRVTAGNAAGTIYDGGTFPLTATTPITSGNHQLFFSIFDQGDSAYDSAVFLDKLTVGTVADGGCVEGARRLLSDPTISVVGSSTSPTGVTKVGLADIPLTSIKPQGPVVPGTAPFGKAPFGKAPFGKAPFGKAPFGKAPFGKAPFGKAPFGKAPFGKASIGTLPFGKAPFGKAPLSEYPLLREGGWSTVLADCGFAGATPQSVSWQELFNTNIATYPNCATNPASPKPIQLNEILVEASPLADFPLLAYLLGGKTWSQITRPAGATAPSWAAEFASIPSCISAVETETVLESASKGCELDLTSLPLATIDGLGDKNATVFWGLTLSELNIKQTFLGDVSLDDIPNLSNVVDCQALGGCLGKKLRDVANSVPSPGANGAWAVDASGATGTFGDLGSAISGNTLSDLVTAFIDPNAVPYESTSLNDLGFQKLSGGGAPTNYVTYEVAAVIGCADTVGTTATVTLPPQFRYRPGSSKISTDGSTPVAANAPSPTGNGETLTFSINAGAALCAGTGSSSLRLQFDAMTGFTLGDAAAQASVSTNSIGAANTGAAEVSVTESFESAADTPANATPILDPNSLVEGHISKTTDVDYYSIDVPVGKTLTVSLSHMSQNYQLVLYAPDGSSQAQSLRPNTAAQPVPVGTEPIVDQGAGGVLPPPALQDIPLAPGKVLAGISDFRDNDPEFINTVGVAGTNGNTTYIVQVSGNNGEHGDAGYTLITREAAAAQLPSCPARTFPNPTPAPSSPIPTIGSTVDTLFLFNQSRMAAQYGATTAASIRSSLESLITTQAGGIHGAIVPVDGSSAVNTASAAWDANPCSPDAANDVVRKINNVVDSLKTGTNNQLGSINNIVIVGEGDIIPHAALPDETFDGNEAGFAGETIFNGNANYLTGAAANQFFLSDAPYGALVPLSVKGKLVYVPQVALGRLAGSAADVQAAITLFQSSNGVADPRTGATATTDPKTAFESDYDFFSDGGKQVADALTGQGRSVTRLSGATWTAAQFETAFEGGAGGPAHVLAPNAHFDQYRLLSANGDTTKNYGDTYTTAGLPAATDSFRLRILFSIGCHFGADFPSSLSSTAGDAPRLNTWSKALAARGSAVMVGNLGYGIGDTATVGFGEVILADFSGGLDGTRTVGKSLQRAQANYFTAMPSFTPYDLKALQEIQLWGMPMYSLSGGTPATSTTPSWSPATAAEVSVAGVSGQKTTIAPTFVQRTASDGRIYVDADGGTNATHPYPIVGKVVRAIPAQNGLVAHGAVPLNWGSIATDPVSNYAFANATYDSGRLEGAPAGQTVYPTTFGNVGTAYRASGAPDQSLVVLPMQFKSGSVNTPANGTLRKWGSAEWLVTYSANTTDFVGPEFGQVDVIGTASTPNTIRATVTDPAGVGRVFAQVLRGTTYSRVELSQTGNPSIWETSTPPVDEVTLFAIDINGNVGTANNSGPGYVAQAAASGAQPTITLTGTPVSGWYTGNVQVSLSPTSFRLKLDGNIVTSNSATVTTAGLHQAEALDSNGTSVTSVKFTIDTGDPTISVTTPTNPPAPNPMPLFMVGQEVRTAFTCGDTGSGIASCVDQSNLPSGSLLNTSAPGVYDFTVTARDNAGHVSSTTSQYRVLQFEGLFQPINALPTANVAKAGSGIPVKWRLTGIDGPFAQSYNFVSITTKTIAGTNCTGAIDQIETYVDTTSGLLYLGSGKWQFNWKTPKTFAGKCVQMSLNLYDGTTAGRAAITAEFSFK